MGGRKKFGSLFFLVVGITVFFGLSSAGCKKKSAQTEKPGTVSQGGTTLGGTQFTSPEDAATKVFGNFSAGPAGMITGRIITARMFGTPGAAPTFSIEQAIDSVLALLLDIRKSRIFEKQYGNVDLSQAFLPSCDNIKQGLQCTGGGSSDVKCNLEGSTTKRLTFDIKLSDCKVYEGGVSTVSTGSIKGYMEVSGNILPGSSGGGSTTSGSFKIVYFIENQDLTVSEFNGGKEAWRLRTVAKNYSSEFSISADATGTMKSEMKLAGSYSNEDILNKKKDEYLFESFGVQVTMSFMGIQNISSLPPSYVSISGKYSFNTSPEDECVKGEFVFKTIEPIKREFGSGIAEDFLCSKSGKFQVNNATFEFSSQGITIKVTSQSSEQSSTYSCKDVSKLCKYEPLPTLTIAAITAGTVVGGIGGGEIGGGETGGGTTGCPVWYKDSDNDGYTDGTTLVSCTKPYGYVASARSGDCDDTNPNINPGKTEVCDGLDNDCDNEVDEGFTRTTYYRDYDRDGYGDPSNSIQACVQPTGYVSNSLDCNDNDPAINPNTVWYKDADNDGYTDGTTQVSCTRPSGFVASARSGDCDDTNPNINPGKTEVCDGLDNDCDNEVDEGFTRTTYYRDYDGDGFGNPSTSIQACSQPPGYVSNSLDCNDNDPAINPNTVWYKDADNDGYTDGTTQRACTKPSAEYVLSALPGDCNDTNASINPGATEQCDGIDNNCNNQTDEGLSDCVSFPPDTTLTSYPPVITSSSTATFSFICSESSCTFECKLDGGSWVSCSSPKTYTDLSDGPHTFQVRAKKGTTPDPTPAYYRWKIEIWKQVSIPANSLHACAIKTDGTLWCWGSNGSGQLGDGTNSHKNLPTQVGSDTNWKIVSAGGYDYYGGGGFTCAIKTDGTLWCWGENYYGQLGDGTSGSWADKWTPTQVAGTNWDKVSAGAEHTCAIKTDGTLWCWGYNGSGQLGDGTNANKSTPTQVGTDTDWAMVSAGGNHTCAIKNDGRLFCWGWNGYGQLGDGTNSEKWTPTQVGTDTDWAMVSAGWHTTCAIKTNGTLWCWGQNDQGQVGDGTTINRNTPRQVGTATNWRTVSSGDDHVCGVKTDGTLWCWGRGIGNSPIRIGTDTDWFDVVAGWYDSNNCALKTNKTLWCWGNNSYGTLGDGTNVSRNNPTRVGIETNWTAITAGREHAFGIRANKTIWGWGRNNYGQLGDLTNTDRNIPTNVGNDVNWTAISAGWEHTCGIMEDNSLWCWGRNIYGQLGNASNSDSNSRRRESTNSTTWRQVSAGGWHTCAIRSNKTLWCWGYNGSGQLGIGGTTNKNTPQQVGIDTNWATVSAGGSHTCGTKIDNTLWCWGGNADGQVGDGSNTNRETPTQVVGDWSTGVSAISAGDYHTCAIKTDGSLWCWGKNNYGQLGIGNTTSKNTPTRVGTDNNWQSVFAGGSHTCAIKTDGSLWCWGRNTYGQLGDGTNTDRNTPIRVGTETGWVAAYLGENFTCALKNDGSLWCWGRNNYYQLGDGTTTDKNNPTLLVK
jgi:alpha-tubulin suppressor-like RCC1 family protein